jgi:hypothetical protein
MLTKRIQNKKSIKSRAKQKTEENEEIIEENPQLTSGLGKIKLKCNRR